MNQNFTDREFELFGTYPGDYPEGGRGTIWSIKARIFFLLVTMALVCGGLAGAMKVHERNLTQQHVAEVR